MLAVFAFQATGLSMSAHLAACDEPGQEAACCQCGHGHDSDSCGFALGDLRAVGHHPASSGKQVPHRHDSQNCGVCQLLLTLAATTDAPLVLPAIDEVTIEPSAPSDRPAVDTLLSTLDARGPPASSL